MQQLPREVVLRIRIYHVVLTRVQFAFCRPGTTPGDGYRFCRRDEFVAHLACGRFALEAEAARIATLPQEDRHLIWQPVCIRSSADSLTEVRVGTAKRRYVLVTSGRELSWQNTNLRSHQPFRQFMSFPVRNNDPRVPRHDDKILLIRHGTREELNANFAHLLPE